MTTGTKLSRHTRKVCTSSSDKNVVNQLLLRRWVIKLDDIINGLCDASLMQSEEKWNRLTYALGQGSVKIHTLRDWAGRIVQVDESVPLRRVTGRIPLYEHERSALLHSIRKRSWNHKTWNLDRISSERPPSHWASPARLRCLILRHPSSKLWGRDASKSNETVAAPQNPTSPCSQSCICPNLHLSYQKCLLFSCLRSPYRLLWLTYLIYASFLVLPLIFASITRHVVAVFPDAVTRSPFYSNK